SDGSNVYPPLRQLVADGLVDTDGPGQPYRLSAAGDGLAPVLGALSAWSAGHPLAHAARHPVWGHPHEGSAPQPWVSNLPRPPAPTAQPVPVSAGQIGPSAWHNRDLFSHAAPARPTTALPAGGPRR
ncbi:winged helix-turn-helix transcriptional regulator, partial [Streptomyces sp. NPDC057654]|uniref:winged helix-turn-helix transcriptional regulator n=1 Tax=Streptomyces sp. NPDC057654 TaxID=3346196 RepID=UPI0036B7DE46